tara:strand:+ start:535 stop:669 length:135 start_codon:yes stop_codon:yes gene_type:complete
MDFATSMFILMNTTILAALGGIMSFDALTRYMNRRKRAISAIKK